jgi:transposase-like protein
MGRINGKNIMRTPKEKEAIVLEYITGKISTRAIAEKYGTTQKVFITWLKKYREANIEGLKSKTGKTGKGKGNYKKTEIEQLKEDLLKKEIELMRLKKGYVVKGVGVKKEYVSILDVNIK